MRMCDRHWKQLREAIAARGLEGLVPKSGEEAAGRLVSEGEQGSTRANFDPLMGAHNAILSNAIEHRGLEIMMQNEDGTDRCPLCYCLATCGCSRDDCPYNTWPDHAADDALAAAKELGLVGAA